ncbi:MAG: tryptophan--tRNA ligase [Acholeplasmatales bacterium]|nr:MAG: tryptophan--tRNA ligase [Acholeplasmatales bacterium]
MKHIVSGIQPTGSLNLGTYLGSIRNFVKLQDTFPEHHFMLFIADLHAITIPRDRLELRKTIRELAALYLACGLRQERLSLFIQSEIPAHSQVAHLLQCFTYIGELERMTQFKEKARRQETGVSAALFTYPVLMAGDILLYDAEYVPVGEDQTQHLELTRDIAERVNSRLGAVFTVPKLLTPKVGARIMSLTEPAQKMSKSDPNEKSRILLLDPEPVIRKRIMSAVTDSDTHVRFDKENKPGISNLLAILSALTDIPIETLEQQHAHSTYATFKQHVADTVVEALRPIQARYQALIQDPELDAFLDAGRDYAAKVAMRKVAKLNHKLGLGRKG